MSQYGRTTKDIVKRIQYDVLSEQWTKHVDLFKGAANTIVGKAIDSAESYANKKRANANYRIPNPVSKSTVPLVSPKQQPNYPWWARPVEIAAALTYSGQAYRIMCALCLGIFDTMWRTQRTRLTEVIRRHGVKETSSGCVRR